MPSDPLTTVLGQARRVLQPDADVQLLGLTEGVLSVKLVQSEGPDCEMCAMSAEDLAAFLMDLLVVQGVAIQSVVVET